jgi:hypothetical protein
MRNISFSLTTDQMLARTKTVTRRVGWTGKNAPLPGMLLQPVRKAMGLRRGEKVEKLGAPIRILNVRRESLGKMLRDAAYGARESRLEGFDCGALEFVRRFCCTHDCEPEDMVTRIEFEYTEP